MKDIGRSVAATGTVRDPRAGFVLLGVLVGVVLALVFAVLVGAAWEQFRRPAEPPLPRELRHAAESLEVRFGGLPTMEVRQGHALWVRPLPDGRWAVLESARSNRVIGFVDGESLEATGSPGGEMDAEPASD